MTTGHKKDIQYSTKPHPQTGKFIKKKRAQGKLLTLWGSEKY